MRAKQHPHLIRRLIALVALAMLVASACSSGSMADTVSSTSNAAMDVVDMSFDDAEAADGAADFGATDLDAMEIEAMDDEVGAEEVRTTGSTGLEAQAQLMDLGRDIIYTAHLDLASTDVSAATRDAVRTIEGLGGFLFSQQTDGRTGTSQLVFKMLPEQFATALDRLGSLGTVRSQAVSAEDVTAIVVDLQSRITTAEASVQRLRGLIDEADEFEIIASLENQLLQRETTLEQLRGQLRSVQNQVDLATINLSIVELVNRPDLSANLTVMPGHDGGEGCAHSGGSASLTVDGPVTVCLQLLNRGDTPLIDLDLTEPLFELELDAFALLDGSVERLEPGMGALLIAEIEVNEPVRSLRTTIQATGLDPDGNVIGTTVQATSRPVWIDIVETEGLPGFGDVLNGSWNAVKTIAILIAIALVAVAPFAAVALVLAPLAVWLWRRMPRPTPRPPTATSAPGTPPPPPASADSASTGDTTEAAEETTVSA